MLEFAKGILICPVVIELKIIIKNKRASRLRLPIAVKNSILINLTLLYVQLRRYLPDVKKRSLASCEEQAV